MIRAIPKRTSTQVAALYPRHAFDELRIRADARGRVVETTIRYGPPGKKRKGAIVRRRIVGRMISATAWRRIEREIDRRYSRSRAQ